MMSHNPYFNRWFSAIDNNRNYVTGGTIVTILILIDGFLQSMSIGLCLILSTVTILILIDGFLQCQQLVRLDFLY